MVGSALLKNLENNNYNNFVLRSHKELDLINQKSTQSFIKNEKPDYIFFAAGKVGGINANNKLRGQFIYENLMIQNNVIHAAFKYNVKKLIFLGSACIYPRDVKQPIKEESLLSDFLEPTNEPYAIAKIAGIKICESYYHQYGCNFISAMPNNLYGPNDNFNLKSSHVLPALIRKFHEAKINKEKEVEIWGSGNPLREFLHVDDLATACIFLMKNLDADQLYKNRISHINIGSTEEVTIKELAMIIKEIVRFDGKLVFNSNYPDGMPRKLLDLSIISSLGWKSSIELRPGIKSVYDWYLNNISKS